MMYIWTEISHFLQFNSANNERLAQDYSAWKGLNDVKGLCVLYSDFRNWYYLYVRGCGDSGLRLLVITMVRGYSSRLSKHMH